MDIFPYHRYKENDHRRKAHRVSEIVQRKKELSNDGFLSIFMNIDPDTVK